MKRFLSVAVPVAAVTLLAGVALAGGGFTGGPMAGGGMGPGMMGPGYMGSHPMGPGHMGPGMMGGGRMGPGMMGGGQGGCPGAAAMGGPAPQAAITEEKAREIATEYTTKYLPGFTVDKVLPFTGMHMTMYSVELKGANDELRVLHINPWGNVMPFGGPWRRGG